MDIQISSNFERYLFEAFDRDAGALSDTMNKFSETGEFSINEDAMKTARQDFDTNRCDDAQTLDVMRKCYEDTGIMIDPHTAVGLSAAYKSKSTNPVVSLACAHGAKFPDAVEKAIGIRPALPPHLSDLLTREEFLTTMPNNLEQVKNFVKSNI